MALFGNKDKPNKGGLLGDVIQSPEQNREWLIYKWRPAGEEAGSTKRENTIRIGSPLRVKQGETAVFQYTAQRQAFTGNTGQGLTTGGGQSDLIIGPVEGKLETANLPILAGLQGLLMGGGTSFPASVFFINTAGIIQTKWAVPYFDMFDPHPQLRYHAVPMAVRGSLTFRITDCNNFISLNALADFDMEKFQKQIRDSIIDKVKKAMADVNTFNKMSGGLPLIQIISYQRNISAILQQELITSLGTVYGITLTELNVTDIELDKESEGYSRLSRLTDSIMENQIKTQEEIAQRGMRDQYDINMSNLKAQQAINLEHMQDSMARSREEAQYAQHMQSDMGGFALHQLKQQEEVAKAAAGAMGQMGQGAGVSMGQGGGFNPGAMMAGVAMGGAVGQGMAGMMGNVFNQMGQQMPGMAPPGAAPPPIPGAGGPPPLPASQPALQFNVSVNGQTYGPYDMNALTQMAGAGQINAQSLVWRQGMAQWQMAGTVPELAPLFAAAGAPPPPPPPPAP